MFSTNINLYYLTAFGIAICSVIILIWLSLGVGIIGDDGHPANFLYSVVIIIGVVGAIHFRLKPKGMALSLTAMAVAQAIIALLAIVTGLGLPWSGPLELILLNCFFVVMFATSAFLFHKAIQN